MTTSSTTPTPAPRHAAGAAAARAVGVATLRATLARRPELFTLALVVLLSAAIGAINPSFFQLATLFDTLRSAAVVGLFALGVLVVLAAGGIDVSFTAIAALTMYGLTKLVLAVWPGAPFVAVLVAGAACGALLGAFNGLLVHRLRAPSLIVTIGTQYLFRGFLLTFVGTTFFMEIPASMDAFGRAALMQERTAQGAVSVLPASVLVFAVAAGVTALLLRRSLMGRALYACGGSLPVAERLGVGLRAVHVFAFGYAGLLAGIGGIVHVSTNRLANPFDLIGMELDVIAAVVLGGARITGGTGTVWGTVLGVILVTLINNVLILAGVPSSWQKLIIGAFILVAGGVFALARTR